MNTKTKTTHNHNNINAKNTAKNTAQKITNWREYNKTLAKRGDFTFFLNIAIQKHALEKPANLHTRGHQLEYSDELIKLILTYREIYHLSLRQAVSFTASLVYRFGYQCKMPNYATLSRRAAQLHIDILPFEYYLYRREPIVFLVDSSGFKICGEGEWFRKKHGTHKPREWQETHVGVDYTSRLVLSFINTRNNVHDNTELIPLLMAADKNAGLMGVNRKLDTIIGDGAYENHLNYHLAEDLQATFIAPPAKNATINVKIAHEQTTDVPGWEARNRVIEAIEKCGGIEKWKELVGYHRRSLVENTFFRVKSIFGDKMMNRTERNRCTEQALRFMILNHFTMLGLPKYS